MPRLCPKPCGRLATAGVFVSIGVVQLIAGIILLRSKYVFLLSGPDFWTSASNVAVASMLSLAASVWKTPKKRRWSPKYVARNNILASLLISAIFINLTTAGILILGEGNTLLSIQLEDEGETEGFASDILAIAYATSVCSPIVCVVVAISALSGNCFQSSSRGCKRQKLKINKKVLEGKGSEFHDWVYIPEKEKAESISTRDTMSSSSSSSTSESDELYSNDSAVSNEKVLRLTSPYVKQPCLTVGELQYTLSKMSQNRRLADEDNSMCGSNNTRLLTPDDFALSMAPEVFDKPMPKRAKNKRQRLPESSVESEIKSYDSDVFVESRSNGNLKKSAVFDVESCVEDNYMDRNRPSTSKRNCVMIETEKYPMFNDCSQNRTSATVHDSAHLEASQKCLQYGISSTGESLSMETLNHSRFNQSVSDHSKNRPVLKNSNEVAELSGNSSMNYSGDGLPKQNIADNQVNQPMKSNSKQMSTSVRNRDNIYQPQKTSPTVQPSQFSEDALNHSSVSKKDTLAEDELDGCFNAQRPQDSELENLQSNTAFNSSVKRQARSTVDTTMDNSMTASLAGEVVPIQVASKSSFSKIPSRLVPVAAPVVPGISQSRRHSDKVSKASSGVNKFKAGRNSGVIFSSFRDDEKERRQIEFINECPKVGSIKVQPKLQIPKRIQSMASISEVMEESNSEQSVSSPAQTSGYASSPDVLSSTSGSPPVEDQIKKSKTTPLNTDEPPHWKIRKSRSRSGKKLDFSDQIIDEDSLIGLSHEELVERQRKNWFFRAELAKRLKENAGS